VSDFHDCNDCNHSRGCPDSGFGSVKCSRFGVAADGWMRCPACGSCGIGGCCPYLCDVCKVHHDGETQTGEPPRNCGAIPAHQWHDPEASK
jgi:hypothetical protein